MNIRHEELYTALRATAQQDGAAAASRWVGWGHPPDDAMLLRMSYLAAVGCIRAATGRVLAPELGAYQRTFIEAFRAAVRGQRGDTR